MKKFVQAVTILFLSSALSTGSLMAQAAKDRITGNKYKIDLSGEWLFQVDSLDEGIQQQWFSKDLKDKIVLPGSMTTNGKGDEIGVNTPWTGGIVDSSWFLNRNMHNIVKRETLKYLFGCNLLSIIKGLHGIKKRLTFPHPGNKSISNCLSNAATGKPPFGSTTNR